MRHRVEGRTLGKEADHRKAMLINMVKSLVINGRITTTHTRALEARKIAERLVAYGRKGTVHHQRLIFALLRDKSLVKKFVETIVPNFEGRNGGYTRVLKKGFRRGDGAPISILEWVHYSVEDIEHKDTEKTDK